MSVLSKIRASLNANYAALSAKIFNRGNAKESITVNHVTVRPVARQTQDIGKWRSALICAEQDHDQRTLLYDLYEDILLDGRMKRLIEQRIQSVTNCKIKFTQNGKPVEDLDTLAMTTAFAEFLREALMSKFWGHSLLELYWQPAGSVLAHTTNLIPRKHVKPKLGIVTKEQWGSEGLPYREKPFTDFVIEIGKANDLGLMLQCSPLVIYKRGGFGDWAEFAETFGMPFRWATYNNDQSRQILETALAEAGSAGYVVAPEDAKLEFHNAIAGGNNNDIFRMLVQACNEELAITILGQTMTTQEAKGSGFAQSKVHENTQGEIHADDRLFVLRILNEKLNPYLASLGYQVKGGEWAFEDGENLPLTERITIDEKLAAFIDIPDDYWYEKYKIPKPKEGSSGGAAEKKPEAVKTSGAKNS